jgi:hypothetical protein
LWAGSVEDIVSANSADLEKSSPLPANDRDGRATIFFRESRNTVLIDQGLSKFRKQYSTSLYHEDVPQLISNDTSHNRNDLTVNSSKTLLVGM